MYLPVFSQAIIDPSDTPGYDQQKLASIVPSSPSGLSLTTDSTDYNPGSTVLISGSGFQSGAVVTLQVVHTSGMFFNDTSVQYQPWNVVADANGVIHASWLVGLNELGSNLKVTADVFVYGLHTEALFTDALPPNPSFVFPDASYTTFPGNDDGSTAQITIPFFFNLYGTNYNHVYVNNNGNLSFAGPNGVYTATGFPSSVPMVAPFWSDVDTRTGNVVKYKVNATNMIVTWQGVGYYSTHLDKLNTFEVIITNGNDTSIGIGNNVCFRYMDMNWTTGDASGGVNGFGGTPATVGVNNGNLTNYVQMGRFSLNSSVYDGGGGANDGVHYLDNQNFLLNVSNAVNQPPSVSGVPTNNKIELVCGTTQTMALSFLPPEVGQNVSVSVNTGGLCNTVVSTTTGTVATANVAITANACNLGSHIITFIATDNFNPPASSTVSVTVNVVAATVTAGSNSPVCNAGTLNLSVSSGATYAWSGPNGFTSTDQNPSVENVTAAASGTYTVAVTSAGGCVSTATTDVTVNPTFEQTNSLTVCANQNYPVLPWNAIAIVGDNSHTYQTTAGCDSIVHFYLTVNPVYNQPSTFIEVCNNQNYPVLPWNAIAIEGDNSHTYQTASGCDSTVTIHLTVLQSTSAEVSASICSGASYTLPDGIVVTVSSGYESHIQNAAGCDSAVFTSLSVNPLPGFEIFTDGSISDCAGGSVTLTVTYNNNNTQRQIASPNFGDTYLWSPGGETANSITVTAAGTYSVTVTNANVCSATKEIVVVSNSCIFPLYPPPVNGKTTDLIGAELTSLYLNFNPSFSTTTDTSQNIFILKSDSVMIEVIALQGHYDSLLNLLPTANYGMSDFVTNGNNTLIITGKYPIVNLQKLNLLPNLIDYCRPVYPAKSNSGIAYDKGDSSMYSDFVRGGYNISGKGVKVGVMSDSYNTKFGNPAALDVLNGDLPDSVEVLKEYPGKGGDEGRAMLQIVHDIAPGAKLAFRTGFVSAGDMAEGIKELQQAGCNVIVDDVTFMTEPFFKDGVIAQAADLVASQGVSYFSAAGNFGVKSYENIFDSAAAPSGILGAAHNFGGGDIKQSISLAPGIYTIVLQWEDNIYSLKQLPGALNDLDIYLTDNNGNKLFGFNRNNIGADPLEVLPFTVTGTSQTNIMIVRALGTGNVRFKYIVFQGNLTMNEFANTGSSTLVGQGNAAGAMAVGAVLYKNTPAFGVDPPTVASFSSRGGTPVNGVYRNKPEFCAPNGVNTTVDFGGGPASNIDANEGDPFPNFFGTSCAAPHAAAVAALLLEGKSKFDNSFLAPSQMRTLMQNTAINMAVPGVVGFDDTASGAGLINAEAAMMTFASPTPLITNLIVPAGITPGHSPFSLIVKGAYFVPTSEIRFRGVPLTTTYISQTQLSANIDSFAGNPPIYVYTPPISNSLLDGGSSDTLYFFTPVKKVITVNADNKSKKYGEQLPAFTASVFVDGVLLADTSLLPGLGLGNIHFACSASSSSFPAIYSITPSAGPFDIGLTELYTYRFNFGLLSIAKMPLVISPRDTTLIFGDNLINNISFNYEYDNSHIALADQSPFLFAIQNDHHAGMINAVAIINGGHGVINSGHGVINGGHGIVNADLENMSILLSRSGLINGGHGVINSGHGVINGGHGIVNGLNDTTMIIDISSESIYQVSHHPDSIDLVFGLGAVNGYDVVNGGHGIVNGGHGIVNGGHGVVNGGHGIVNSGHGIVNSTSITDSSNQHIVFIIDSLDVYGDSLSDLVSVNMITGVTSGVQTVVPGAFISDLFDVTYHFGNITILPAPLIVEALNKETHCGVQPAYTSHIVGYQYDDNDSTVIVTPPGYTVYNGAIPAGNGNLFGGPYNIKPGGLKQIPDSNYVVIYLNGILTSAPQLVASKVVGTIPCNGGTTTVTITASGGTPPYSGDGVKTVSVGSYSFTVTDSKGCSVVVSGTVTQPAVLSASALGNISCFAGTATVNVTAAGGTTVYVGTGAFPNQGPGLHTYTVTDAHGCSAAASITLVNPSEIIVTATPGAIPCFGGSSCVTVSAIGGSGIYTGGTGVICGYPAGTYTFTVSDIKNCTGSATISIFEPSKITGTIATTPATCGLNNGTAKVTATGGTGLYTYVWNSVPVQTTQIATGLAVGSYVVTITDGNSCTGLSLGVIGTAGGGFPPAPVFTSGPEGACQNTNVTYCVASIPGATSYRWTIPLHATVVGSSNSSCIIIRFDDHYAGGFVCVKATSVCGTGSQSCINVPLLTKKPQVPGAISSSAQICSVPVTVVYSIAPVANATSYSWSVSGTGLLLVSGQGTTSITVNVSAGFTSGTVKVKASNCIGISDQKSLAVTFAGSVNKPTFCVANSNDNHTTGICPGSIHEYEICLNGAACYTWTAPSGAVIRQRSGLGVGNPLTICSGNQMDVDVTFPSGFVSGYITVSASNTCHSSASSTLFVQNIGPCVARMMQQGNQSEENSGMKELTAYPNPTSGKLSVTFNATAKEKYILKISDLLGNVLIHEVNTAVEENNFIELDLRGISYGIYLLSIEQDGMQTKTMRIVIQ